MRPPVIDLTRAAAPRSLSVEIVILAAMLAGLWSGVGVLEVAALAACWVLFALALLLLLLDGGPTGPTVRRQHRPIWRSVTINLLYAAVIASLATFAHWFALAAFSVTMLISLFVQRKS